MEDYIFVIPALVLTLIIIYLFLRFIVTEKRDKQR